MLVWRDNLIDWAYLVSRTPKLMDKAQRGSTVIGVLWELERESTVRLWESFTKRAPQQSPRTVTRHASRPLEASLNNAF